MAKIVLSEEAPQGEAVKFSLGNAEPFEAPFETDNQSLLASAEVHPWLTVERDPEEVNKVEAPEQHVSPERDSQSVVNSVAFDAEAVAKAREEAAEAAENRLAVESSLDQDTPAEVGNVGVTLAADDDFKEDDE